jgi:hypothetical protein
MIRIQWCYNFHCVKTSNYTEVTVNNQTEYNAILNACSSAESSGQAAITSLNINFPITILTYNVSLQQTGVWLSHPKSNCLRI